MEVIFKTISDLINLAAGLIIVWGTAYAFVKVVFYELVKIADSKNIQRDLHKIRDVFGHRLALGLEFFVAADLLSLIFNHSIEELINIGALVAIRIAITFFLEKEID